MQSIFYHDQTKKIGHRKKLVSRCSEILPFCIFLGIEAKELDFYNVKVSVNDGW